MKRLLLIFFILPLFSKSQKDSIYIIKNVDDMTDKTYYFPSRKLVVTDSLKTKGFSITPDLNKNIELTDLIVKIIKIGDCNEKDELILMFEDSTKIKLISYAGFNCKGDAYYKIGKKDIEKFKTLKVIKAKIINGRSYDSFTNTIPDFNQNYFMQLLYACDTKKIKTPPVKK